MKTQGFLNRWRTGRRGMALKLFPSRALFIAGLCIMPAFLFNPTTELRFLQFLLFWAFALLVGRKNSLVVTLVMGFGIVLFNLLVPYGRILFQWHFIRITEGALRSGIEKALTVEGLILLSKASIRSDLRLPGRFGELIGESFSYFELIMEKKSVLDRKDPIGSIDRLMIELSEETELLATGRDESKQGSGQTRPKIGLIILALAVTLAWIPFLIAVQRG